jgi:hypothetical protein
MEDLAMTRETGRSLSILLITSVIAAITSACKSDPLTPLAPSQFANPPQTVAVSIMNYVPAQGKAFKDLFVSNFSVKAAKGALSLNTARDGLPDTLKQQIASTYGFTVGTNAYSINAGFSDLVLYLMGVTLSQESLLSCAPNLQNSSSNDAFTFTDARLSAGITAFLGLRDCEKQYLGLNPALFDNNGNGIPDYLKLRCGLNPANTHDSHLNVAADGVSNYDKCKQNIPADESSNSQANTLFAYQYNFEVHADGSQNLYVTNIPILNGGQDNFIAFYLTEVDLSTKAESLYTAFTILGAGSNGVTLKFNYWATDPNKYTNQQVVPQ